MNDSQILYFRTLSEAFARRANEGWQQRPRKRSVWIYPSWEKVWSLDRRLERLSGLPAMQPVESGDPDAAEDDRA